MGSSKNVWSRLLLCLLLAVSFCCSENLKPKVVGPVSQYGELQAGRIKGKGRIYGSCKGVKPGKEVQLRGLSLYWSLVPEATEFYSEKAIAQMVKDLKVQIIRIAVATHEDWGKGYSGYVKNPEQQLALIKQVVEAAVANDIYVIIDWHSHTAPSQYKESTAFFEKMAKEYGHLDNVIFEVFNEPNGQSWFQIRGYVQLAIDAIRPYSDNLILVANPGWDQHPDAAIGKEPKDPKNNIAYTFHFYSNSHTIEKEGAAALKALEAGLPLFVTEWGATDYEVKQFPNVEAAMMWQKFMDKYKISSVNWSASKVTETSSAFLPESSEDQLVLSESGKLMKKIMNANPNSYKKCRH